MKIANINNLSLVSVAMERLVNRQDGLPGLGVLYGPSGWDSEVPAVAPRYKLEPLFWLADQFFYFMSSMNEMKTGEPLPFCFMVNPEPLKKPVVHYYE